MAVSRITTPTFVSFIHTHKYTVIDFYADWCGPCKMMASLMEKMSEQFVNQNISFGKVNIDLDAPIAKKFGITSIPTVIIFDLGKPINSFVGYRPEAEIKNFIFNTCIKK